MFVLVLFSNSLFADNIVKKKYDKIGNFYEGLAAAKLNDKWGFIDENGKEITPLKYEWVFSFNEGFAAVSIDGKHAPNEYVDGKWGFIDKNGKEITPITYSYAYKFSEGLALVAMGRMYSSEERYGFINTKGQIVIPLIYEQADRDGFLNGKAIVKFNEKWGSIDKNGNFIPDEN